MCLTTCTKHPQEVVQVYFAPSDGLGGYSRGAQPCICSASTVGDSGSASYGKTSRGRLYLLMSTDSQRLEMTEFAACNTVWTWVGPAPSDSPNVGPFRLSAPAFFTLPPLLLPSPCISSLTASSNRACAHTSPGHLSYGG